MYWKMYLDNIRYPKQEDFVICRTFQEAVELIQKRNSIPNHISFDHDLGIFSGVIQEDGYFKELSGYDFAKWLVEQDLNEVYKFPKDFEFNVHSANPVWKRNIEGYLNNYFSFLFCI